MPRKVAAPPRLRKNPETSITLASSYDVHAQKIFSWRFAVQWASPAETGHSFTAHRTVYQVQQVYLKIGWMKWPVGEDLGAKNSP